MRYRDYDIENFLTDEFFIQWIKTPNENNRHFWEKWLEQHPDKRETVMEAINIISSIHYREKEEFTDRLYVDTFENIVKAEKGSFFERYPASKKQKWYPFFSFRQIAASLLVLFCFGMAYDVMFQTKVEDTVKKEITTIKRANPSGTKSVITLSDGTIIYLNSESEIQYPDEFSDSLRWISLIGEAFFEVRKDSRPFVVETRETKIQVLGTSFNVNQKQNGSLSVALVSGKVRVNDSLGNQVNLEPSEMLVMGEGGKLYKTDFDPLEITGWKDKYLVFKSNDFEEVKAKIEKWYGVQIQLSGNIPARWSYSGTYVDETLENVLRGIFLTSGIKYKIENKKVIITNPK